MTKYYKSLFRLLILMIILFGFVQNFSPHVFADPTDELDNQETYIRGKVIQIVSAKSTSFQNTKSYEENLKVQLLEGREKNKIVSVSYSADETYGINERVGNGDFVVVDSKPLPPKNTMTYSIYEPYRLNNFWWVLGAFIILIVGIAGKKGVGALVGLSISILTISIYIVPQIIQGHDPLTVCVTASIFILFLTTYLAHGVSVKTTVAVLGTGISLAIAAYLSVFCVQFIRLFGFGNEDVQSIIIGTLHPINAQGLLLGGILIGTLGALNDITTTQSASIFTLANENPRQHFQELFRKGMAIGREHIASLINTLVLAYAGTSLAIFLFFNLNPAHLPWWVILNNEASMEEIMRTLIGSAALIIAVPITSCIATYVALNWKPFLKIVKENL